MKRSSQDYTKWNLPEGSKARFGKGRVSEIAYTPDGTRLAVATSIGIWLYDSQTGEDVDLLTDGYSIMEFSSTVGFGPNVVNIIGSDNSDETIRLSEAHTGKHIKTLKGHTDTVSAETFSLYGKTIIGKGCKSVLTDQYWADIHDIHLWDAHTGKHIKTISGQSVAFSADGNRIANSDDSAIHLWDAHTGKHIKTISGQSVVFSADGNKIASGDDGAIHLWDAHTGKHIKTIRKYTELVRGIVFSPDGNKIISEGCRLHCDYNEYFCTFDLWDAHTGKHIETLAEGFDVDGSPLPGIHGIIFSQNGDRIVVPFALFERDSLSREEYEFDLIEAHTGKRIKKLGRFEVDPFENFVSLMFNPSGEIVALSWVDNPRDQFNPDPYEHDHDYNRYELDSTRRICLWNSYTGEHMGTISGHSMVFSPHGNQIASINGSGICLWNSYTGEHMGTISGHSMAFSPHGNQIASVNGDEVYLWNAHTGEHIKTLRGHLRSSIAFSPDRKTIAAGNIGEVYLWNTHTGKHIKTLTIKSVDSQPIDIPEDYRNYSIMFSPDGKTIAADNNGEVYLWNAHTGEHIKTLTIKPVDSQPIDAPEDYHRYSITFSPDGKTIAAVAGSEVYLLNAYSAGNIGEVYLWNAHTGEHIKTLTIKSADLQPIDIPEDYNSDSIEISEHYHSFSIAFSPDGRTIAAGASGKVDLWTGRIGEHSAGNIGEVYLWNAHTGEHIKTLAIKSVDLHLQPIDIPEHYNSDFINHSFSIAFSPDGRTIAAGASVWNAYTGKHIETLSGHLYSSGVFSPDGKTIAAGNRDSNEDSWEVCLWKAHTGKHIKTLKADGSSEPSLVFSPDGKIILIDNEIWDTHTGKHIKTLKGYHAYSGSSLVFSPDGKIIAGSGRESLKVWDMETGSPINTLTGNVGEITDIAFDLNGRTLTTRNRDGTVLLWDVDLLRSEVISAKENTDFLNRESRIQQICEDRGITTLVHFTRIEYLRNILHEGLLDHQSLLKKHGQQFSPNDKQRIDGHKEAICLSISFPNRQLFQKFSWSDVHGQPDYSGWVVLVLDAKVLWELDCAFCQENAASNAVRHILIEERKNPEALENMFTEVCRDTKGNVYQRQSLQIPDNYPTHPQAEVLVFDRISSDYIKEVHFYDESALKQWRDNNPWINPERLFHNQQYFRDRRDQVVWEDDNLDDDIPFGSRINDNDDDIPF